MTWIVAAAKADVIEKWTDSMKAPERRILPSSLLIILVFSTASRCAWGDELFNPVFLERVGDQTQKSDLSVFSQGTQIPGVYRVDVLLNDNFVETRDVPFILQVDADGEKSLQPCFSAEELQQYGVNVAGFPGLKEGGKCAKLSVIPDASASFVFASQRLLLSIPQAALNVLARGYVPPSQWDEGIPALFINYSFTGAQNKSRDRAVKDSDSQYLNLRPGLNIGAWRLRHYSTWNRDSNGGSRWDSVYTFAQRNIIALKSQLTLGESSSPSDIFDSVPFRGGQLASDDEMLPDSLKSYAPVVRGIARTNARIIIRQNGYTIYQSYVAPGAFTINDMYPTGGSGDLYVTVKEADGSEQHIVVPFASVPILQREGRFKYSITSGQYRAYNGSARRKAFTQATGMLGLAYGFTFYGGTQLMSKYQSLAIGLGKNFGRFGAISADVIQAWSTPDNQPKENGQSWRLRYSKNFVQTGTNFAIAGYRYSTRGYYTMNEVLDSFSDNGHNWLERRRNRAEMTVSQSLWEGAGSLTLGLFSEDYWNNNRKTRAVSVGYNNSWKGISYGLNYTYNRNSIHASSGRGSRKVYDKDQIFAFNVSVPLDKFMGNTWATYSLNSARPGKSTNTVGLSGTLLEDNNLSWNIQESFASRKEGDSGNLGADYKATYGGLSGGYAWDKNMRRINYGVEGGVVIHPNGVTLSQPLGETAALVKAPGVRGTTIASETGVKTDFRGYTIIPYVSPYRRNDVTLVPETLPDDVDLEQTSQTVIPTRGAIVRADFVGQIGQRMLLTLTQNDGRPVPFGATVVVEGERAGSNGIVGDGGQVYLSGLKGNERLSVSWGSGAASQCQAVVSLPERENSVLRQNARCQ